MHGAAAARGLTSPTTNRRGEDKTPPCMECCEDGGGYTKIFAILRDSTVGLEAAVE